MIFNHKEVIKIENTNEENMSVEEKMAKCYSFDKFRPYMIERLLEYSSPKITSEELDAKCRFKTGTINRFILEELKPTYEELEIIALKLEIPSQNLLG